MLKPEVDLRKPKPDAMPSEARLASVLSMNHQTSATNAARTRTCVISARARGSFHRDVRAARRLPVLAAVSSTATARSPCPGGSAGWGSEEHTSELQPLMRLSYDVF